VSEKEREREESLKERMASVRRRDSISSHTRQFLLEEEKCAMKFSKVYYNKD